LAAFLIVDMDYASGDVTQFSQSFTGVLEVDVASQKALNPAVSAGIASGQLNSLHTLSMKAVYFF
jgi:hypothetical protein